MRFDYAVWKSLPGLMGLGYSMEVLESRARRFTSALDAAGIPYAVCGGMSVIAWVSSRNEDYTRTTKDLDVCMRRADLDRAEAALLPHGFEFTEVNGVPGFLDGPGSFPRHAVHLVFAGEPASRKEKLLVPDFGITLRDERFPWARVDLDTLLAMKLLAMRPHDLAHIGDLIRVGLMNRSFRGRLPEALRERFDRAMDECERAYLDSGH